MTSPRARTTTPASSAEDGARARIVFRAALAAAGAFLLLLAWPILRGEVYALDDLGAYHIPLRAFYARCLASGESFDWIPNLFCGFYLQGEGQVGMYHPLHLLLYRCLPLHAAFGLELVLTYPFLIAGTILFLSRQGLRRDAAIFGALVFAFASFQLLHFVHPNAVGVLAHLPWILWAIDAIVRGEDARVVRRGKWSLALLLGSQLLLGHPQAFWISSLGALLWFVFLLPHLVRRGSGGGEGSDVVPRLRRLLALVEAAIVGLLLGAVQILPTLEAAADSTRDAPSEAFLQAGSLHYGNVLQLLEPYFFAGRVLAPDSLDYNTHEFGFYCGALVPVLVAWLVARRLRERRRLAIGAFVLLGIALLLSAGGWIPPLHRLVMHLPGVGLFRNSARYLVLAELALAVLAAIGFADLVKSLSPATSNQADGTKWTNSSRTAAIVLLVPLASALLALVGPARLHVASSRLVWSTGPDSIVWLGPALSATAALLVLLAARGSRAALVLVPVFAVADQGFYGWSYLRSARPTTVASLAAATPLPARGSSERTLCLPPTNIPVIDDLRLANGYAGLVPRRRLADVPSDPDGALARAWVVASGTSWIVEEDGTIQVPDPMPRAHLVARTVVSQDAGAFAACDFAREALVDDPLPLPDDLLPHHDDPLPLPEASPGRATVVLDRPGLIRVATECDSKQLLVLTEAWHRGWRVAIDGAPAPLLRVDLDFQGALVSAGAHAVEFRFDPDSLRRGRRLSLLGLVLLGVSLLAGFRLARRS